MSRFIPLIAVILLVILFFLAINTRVNELRRNAAIKAQENNKVLQVSLGNSEMLCIKNKSGVLHIRKVE